MRFASLLCALPALATAYSVFQLQDDGLQTMIPGDSPIDTCESPAPADDILDIQSLIITPNPPEKGQNLTITASGFVKEDITEGAYVELEVKYGLIRLIRQTVDLCEQTKKVDLNCPIKEGAMTLTKEVELPKQIPPGRYTVNARVFSAKDEQITCLVAKVQ